MRKPIFVFVLISLTATKSLAVFADNPINFSADQTKTKFSISTIRGVEPGKPLQGAIEKVELNVNVLQDVGLDLKSALKAATNIYDEATRTPVRILTQPEAIGGGTIINLPVGTEPTGPPQPIRKEYLDSAMRRMEPIIDGLKKNVDEFVAGKKQLDLPPDVMTKLQPQFQDWIRTVNNIAVKQRHLEQLTYNPPYDNITIAALASLICDYIKDLDKTRLEVYKVIRKEGKRRSSV